MSGVVGRRLLLVNGLTWGVALWCGSQRLLDLASVPGNDHVVCDPSVPQDLLRRVAVVQSAVQGESWDASVLAPATT